MEPPSSPAIAVDDRELKSKAARRLFELGARLDSRRLAVGDFAVSDRCCIERKSGPDLENSIIDNRLFSQAVEICESYTAPILAIVAPEYSRLNPKAVRGALASIAVDFRIPVFFFNTEEELADFVFALAQREQSEHGIPRLQTERKGTVLSDQQQLVVESIPTVGPVHAKDLLSHFKSVKAVFDASEKELMDVEGIGKVRARKIREVIDSKYG